MWDKMKFYWSMTNRWHRLTLVFLILESNLIPGGQVGFQCNDPALSHTFTGDTISFKWLVGATVFLPFAVMLIVERKYHNEKPLSKERAIFWYKEYLFGELINVTLVQFLKVLVGSPRPHFFDTCRPEEAQSCQGSEFVSKYTCTKAHWLSQSDKSFPSGHTSLALHAGIFIAYYLYQRTNRPNRSILSIQCICISSAIFCCVSRMTDHRHHWWDVLAGAVVAVPILVYTIFFLCRNFESYQHNNISKNDQTNFKNDMNEQTVPESNTKQPIS